MKVAKRVRDSMPNREGCVVRDADSGYELN